MPIPGRPIARLKAAFQGFKGGVRAAAIDQQPLQNPRLARLANLTPGQRRGGGGGSNQARNTMDFKIEDELRHGVPHERASLTSQTLSPPGEAEPLEQIQLSDAAPVQQEEAGKPGLFKRFKQGFNLNTEEGRSAVFGLAGAIGAASNTASGARTAAFAKSQREEIAGAAKTKADEEARQRQLEVMENKDRRQQQEFDLGTMINTAAGVFRRDPKTGQLERMGDTSPKTKPTFLKDANGQNQLIIEDPSVEGGHRAIPLVGDAAKAEKMDQRTLIAVSKASSTQALGKGVARLREMINAGKVPQSEMVNIERALAKGESGLEADADFARTHFALSSVLSVLGESDRGVVLEFQQRSFDSFADADEGAQRERIAEELVFPPPRGEDQTRSPGAASYGGRSELRQPDTSVKLSLFEDQSTPTRKRRVNTSGSRAFIE